MFKNFVKITFRNLKKRKTHAAINILGLAVAIASCIFVGLYVQYEQSYDTFYENSDATYRIVQKITSPDKTEHDATTPYPLAPTLEAEFPRFIDKSVRLFNNLNEQHTFMVAEDTANITISTLDSYLESDFYFADSLFFQVFDHQLIRGNPETALKSPLSVVLTPELARTFFGDEDPMGKVVFYNTTRMPMTVTGIMEPMPENAHFKADILASFISLDNYFSNPEAIHSNWFGNRYWSYIQLHDGINPDELSRQFPGFVDKYYASTQNKDALFELDLQPLERIHLHSDLNYELQPNSSAFYMYLFACGALLLLIIAIINFTNLATAHAAERRREVGMHKVLGANKSQLFGQFIAEALFLSLIAVLLASALVALGMPYFSSFVGLPIAFNPFTNLYLFLSLVFLWLLTGVFAGLYPAVYLSTFEPGQILRGNSTSGRERSLLRKGLVALQFCMSVTVIIGTIIVYLQLDHMQDQEMGFQKERIAIMPISQNLIAWEFDSFKERAEQHAAIENVTGMGKILGSDKTDSWKIAPAGNAGSQGETNHTLWVLHDFVETYDLEMVAGRSFSKDYGTDESQGLLINEQMVAKLGYDNPRDAIGELFYYTTSDGTQNPLNVIGVVKDFNYASVKNEIKPTVICLAYNQQYRLGAIQYAAAKIIPGRTEEALAHLDEIWSDINYITPFNYSFQDQELAQIYSTETVTSSVMSIFTILCIFTACMGLFGLASFTAERRTREIGIRKTLGATEGNIIWLLTKEYAAIVILANIVAWPIVYYGSAWWLQDFPFRIQLGWNMALIFLVTALASLAICILTVGYHATKASLMNPVESIQHE